MISGASCGGIAVTTSIAKNKLTRRASEGKNEFKRVGLSTPTILRNLVIGKERSPPLIACIMNGLEEFCSVPDHKRRVVGWTAKERLGERLGTGPNFVPKLLQTKENSWGWH